MNGSYLRVELRSPKRNLDGGYGFDLTKYCASCWTRLGRILGRGARCNICGRRVCKRCRHFVSAKEWICALCYKKKYTPVDSWHDDANTKQFKGSQGKSGTYLLRLTDWSAHGVLEVHKVNAYQSGRIHSFYNEVSRVDYLTKSKHYRKNLSKSSKSRSKFYCSLAKPCFNYPLIQQDIQLRNCKAPDHKMSPKARKENYLKYTSTNLKQKRREMRECKALSPIRGRHSGGTLNEHSKKHRSTRIKSTKQEQYESVKTLFRNNISPFASSTGKSKTNISSSVTPSWQKDHRRSSRNIDNFFYPSILDRNESNIRFSVRGTRIFGRRKSYRAYPALKGDARSNGTFIKSRSSSLPCELSQVESHDYEFWSSGFVQSRVRKLEEELTSKCEDKFSYSHDYEVQSLCSLNLDKIQPDGDDYRIAYLSSTSQESSLDYMDDYCTIGMGTLDVKLNKKCVLVGNEDWDLTLSSEENDATSEDDDDDEFFYRKYSNGDISKSQTIKYMPRSHCISNESDNTEQCEPNYGKTYSNILGAGDTDDSKSTIIQQIHENVDRIFYNVMQYDFDIPQPVQGKPNKLFTLEYSSYLPNDKNKDENDNLFEQKETTNQNKLMNFNLNPVSVEHYKNFSQNKEQNDNITRSSEESSLLNPLDYSHQNNSSGECLERNYKTFSNKFSTSDYFPEICNSNITSPITGGNKHSNEKLSDNLFCDFSSMKTDTNYNDLVTENANREKKDPISNCLTYNDSLIKTAENITNDSNPSYLRCTPEQLLLLRNTENKASEIEQTSVCVNGESGAFKIAQKDHNCTDLISFNEVKPKNDHFPTLNVTNYNKCNLENEIVKLTEISHSNNKFLKYTTSNKWFERNKVTSDFSETKSLLEVEIVFYEPLCTPFAEIYFITYGKNYPENSCYKLSVPRKILKDIVNEININDQNMLTYNEEFSHELNRTNCVIKSYAIENIFDITSANSAKKCKNYETHSTDIHSFRNYNKCQNLSSVYPNVKSIERSRCSVSDNYFPIFEQNEKMVYQCNKISPMIIFSGSEELFQNAYRAIHFHFQNNSRSNIFYNKFREERDVSEHFTNLFYNQYTFESFLLNLLESRILIHRENDRGIIDYYSARFPAVDSNLSIFNTTPFLSINMAQLFNFLSHFLNIGKSCTKFNIPNFGSYQRKKFLKKARHSLKYIERQPEFNLDLSSNPDQKSSNNDIQSRINLKKKLYSKLKKTDVYFTETKNKISKNHYRLKNKKCRRNKAVNVYKNPTENKKNYKVCKNHRKMMTLTKPGVCKQRIRNRNYGIDNYFLRETEVSIETPQAVENSFAAESLANLTTSLTSNATFVKYLFPPQLVSVRDTAKTRLSVSSIQNIQSVPAVQRRLADRESRFTQLVKNHKHGSFRAATASITDRYCGSQDFCALKSVCNGYPVALNSCKTEKITTQDHDFEDYVCFGSVPKGLQQLICDQVIFGDAKWITLNPACAPLFESQENMATCEENPRLINKVTRTPGKNISKLRKLFDTGECDVSDSDCLYSKKDNSISSQSTNVNTVLNISQNTGHKSENSEHLSNNKNDSALNLTNNNFTGRDKNETVENKPQQRVSSDIPYCRKISQGGDLWKNVDIGVKSSNDGLWSSAPSNDYCDDSFDYTDLRQGNSSFVSSTTDLHNLIASSKAELSKKKEPLLSDKSTLENYFTSFENSKPKKFVPLSSDEQSVLTNDFSNREISVNQNLKTPVTYDCDAEEMNFDEEDAVFSDTSSDEELRCSSNPNLNNTHYLPAYALHTIIEESCEESERDSRNTTPTNEPVTSKLERYFSWDIINDTETDIKRKGDDESTVFSDSLSEGSGSLNGDASKEIDPSQLASSRLEKYFTSGLVGNENYFYPDDAEFLEDGPVSDFEEDSIHQKISRSALISSLENVAEKQESEDNESVEINDKDSDLVDRNVSEKAEELPCDILIHDSNSSSPEKDIKDLPKQNPQSDTLTASEEIVTNDLSEESDEIKKIEITKPDEITIQASNSSIDAVLSSDLDNLKNSETERKSDTELVENVLANDASTQKPSVCKEQLAIDVRAIIKKLLVYFSDSEPNSFKHNIETDYISAWQILETEIERLIQSISPTSSMENNSCNSSTIDSNNSDYGSDTIESLECMTDEDESADSKNRGNVKYPIVELFNAAYKIQPGSEFHNFNISDETLSIWKRLIQSLQKDSFCMSDKLYDPNTEARLYIRDQIVNLMHTVTVNENKVGEINSKVSNIQDEEIASSLIEENNTSENINEAYNVSVSGGILTYSKRDGLLTSEIESSDDATSIENFENMEIKTMNEISDDESKISNVDIILDSDLQKSFFENPEVGVEDELQNIHPSVEEININEIDIKLNSPESSDEKLALSSDSDIDLNGDMQSITPEKCESHLEVEYSEVSDAVKRSSLHLWVSGENEHVDKEKKPDPANMLLKEDSLYVDEMSDLPEASGITGDVDLASDFKTAQKSYRDTGYYSFKSSDDSILHDTPPPDEFMDVPNFKSLKRSIKKFPLGSTLSKSSTNINQVFSVSDNKFNTLQLKSHKTKKSSNSTSSPSRQFTSLFSPTAVFKKLTGSKNNDTQIPESSIPSKYLKKYARSSSMETESMVGAISMPQLNCPRTGDSYSALGLYSENDRDSSIIADDDIEPRRYPAYSQSVLSLGVHSASMTSVYSAAACHYGYVTVSGDVLFGLNYNQKSQMMEVFIKQCRNLAAVDVKRNKSDPYVKVYLLPDKTKGGKRKTKTKKNTLNPIFNELLRFPVLKHELESRTLWLSVWNSDLFGRNDFLGEVMLPLGYRLLDSPTLRWYPLQERMESLTSPLNYRGELFLALKYVPRDLSLESRFRPAPVISLRGALHVLVKEARNISANGSGGNLDAFCKSYLLPDKSKSSKQKTPVVKRSRHPKWYYTMIYEDLSIDELKERSLELTVWDHDKITSNEFMGGIRLNLGSGLYHGVSVEWMDARRDEAALWEAMLQSPNMWVDGCLPLRPTMQFHHG